MAGGVSYPWGQMHSLDVRALGNALKEYEVAKNDYRKGLITDEELKESEAEFRVVEKEIGKKYGF